MRVTKANGQVMTSLMDNKCKAVMIDLTGEDADIGHHGKAKRKDEGLGGGGTSGLSAQAKGRF